VVERHSWAAIESVVEDFLSFDSFSLHDFDDDDEAESFETSDSTPNDNDDDDEQEEDAEDEDDDIKSIVSSTLVDSVFADLDAHEDANLEAFLSFGGGSSDTWRGTANKLYILYLYFTCTIL